MNRTPSTCALGIDLGGSSIQAVAVGPDRRVFFQRQISSDPKVTLDGPGQVRTLVQALCNEAGLPVVAVGLAVPDLAAAHTRQCTPMLAGLLTSERMDWAHILESPVPVAVMTKGRAALLGEAWLGAARGLHHAVLLLLGAGVAGAAMVDGHLLQGAIGRAGHLGHVSLDSEGKPDGVNTPGSLAWAIGDGTIRERSQGRFRTTRDLIAAHRAGHAQATTVWLKSVKVLAAAIGSFINLFDPEAILIGGETANAGETLFKPLLYYLESLEWRAGGHRVQIVPAQLAEYAGAFGAARHAMLEANPGS